MPRQPEMFVHELGLSPEQAQRLVRIARTASAHTRRAVFLQTPGNVREHRTLCVSSVVADHHQLWASL